MAIHDLDEIITIHFIHDYDDSLNFCRFWTTTTTTTTFALGWRPPIFYISLFSISSLRTSETNYLNEAFSFYAAIRGRAYYSRAVREDRYELQRSVCSYFIACMYIYVCGGI